MADELKKKRNYCFTLNNYTQEDIPRILAWKDAKYIVFGQEEGKDGTPHLQGYVEWKEGKAIQPTLKKLGSGFHWEERKASAATAAAYCKKGSQSHAEWSDKGIDGPNYGKDAVIHETGTISAPGKRTDLKDCAEMIMNGTSLADVAAHDPGTFVKYHKGFARREFVKIRTRNEALDVRVYAKAALALLNVNLNGLAMKMSHRKEAQAEVKQQKPLPRPKNPSSFVNRWR